MKEERALRIPHWNIIVGRPRDDMSSFLLFYSLGRKLLRTVMCSYLSINESENVVKGFCKEEELMNFTQQFTFFVIDGGTSHCITNYYCWNLNNGNMSYAYYIVLKL
jgi:hypothetical protein